MKTLKDLFLNLPSDQNVSSIKEDLMINRLFIEYVFIHKDNLESLNASQQLKLQFINRTDEETKIKTLLSFQNSNDFFL